jgi:hypothetical protein
MEILNFGNFTKNRVPGPALYWFCNFILLINIFYMIIESVQIKMLMPFVHVCHPGSGQFVTKPMTVIHRHAEMEDSV